MNRGGVGPEDGGGPTHPPARLSTEYRTYRIDTLLCIYIKIDVSPVCLPEVSDLGALLHFSSENLLHPLSAPSHTSTTPFPSDDFFLFYQSGLQAYLLYYLLT